VEQSVSSFPASFSRQAVLRRRTRHGDWFMINRTTILGSLPDRCFFGRNFGKSARQYTLIVAEADTGGQHQTGAGPPWSEVKIRSLNAWAHPWHTQATQLPLPNASLSVTMPR
jgi:hypothetical protein